jgi:hypothetical protein
VSKIIPTAVVIDRVAAARMPAGLDDMGGAWAEMFRVWQRTDMEYVVMLAHTKERLRLRAPLTALARDVDGLRTAMVAMCAHLNNVKCQWVILMEEGTDGIALVRELLLMETRLEGRA